MSKEVFSTSNNKFIHLIEEIFEKLYQHRFSHIYGFSLVGSKAFFSSCFKKLFRRSHIYMFLVFLNHDFLSLFHFLTFLISLYPFHTFLFEPIAPGGKYSSADHSDLENNNVFCEKVKCKVNLCNI